MEERIQPAGIPAENAESNAAQEGVVAPEETMQPTPFAQENERTEDAGGEETAAEGAQAKQKQSRRENSKMKELRRKADQYDATAERMIGLARAKGLHPADAAEAMDLLEAHERGAATEGDRADLEAFRIEREMKRDLAAIQAVDPTVLSLDALGEEYRELVAAGITGLNAFYAMRGKEAIQNAAVPPTTGTVGGKNDDERDLTGEELDRLTEKDLDDQRLFERAMRSLHKLKSF